MRKLVVFMHTSLDGYVCGPNGEMDWIQVDAEIFKYAGQATKQADTALYGRVTYEMMQAYWPTAAEQPNASEHDREHSAWYNQVEKVVLSTTLSDDGLQNTRIISSHIRDEINKIKEETGKDILVFGSPGACHSLMKENLIDEYWLFVNPVLLGQGKPMFRDISHKTLLTLLEQKQFTNGVSCLHYQLKS